VSRGGGVCGSVPRTEGRHLALITVGVPVYNGERYLARTLDSLLKQTVRDFVVLVGDNASTDGTAAIVESYAARDPRVRHVRHPHNLGAAANYTRLCEMADTEFFRWSAADDCSEPRFLEACLEGLRRDPEAVLVYPRIMMIDAEDRRLGEHEEGLHLPHARPSDRFFTLLQNIRLCNALYGVGRTKAFRRTRLLGSYLGSDMVFQAELTLYGRILEVPEPLLLRRMHADSFTSMTLEQQREFMNPGRGRRVELYRWRHWAEHYRSVMRAPLPLGERVKLMGGLARRMVWARDDFLQELLAAARGLVTRSPG
jgi:glycosyltransferase involved in cell wall biosynthesis